MPFENDGLRGVYNSLSFLRQRFEEREGYKNEVELIDKYKIFQAVKMLFI